MLAELKPYSEYKDSGEPWLGAVPAHWEILALKRLAMFKSGAGFPVGEQGQSGIELPFFKVSDMNLPGNEKSMVRSNNSVSRETATRLGATVFPARTIIFPKVGGALLTNKRRVLERDSCMDNNLMGCVVRRGEPDFILLLLRMIDLGTIAKPGPVPAISEGEVREIRGALPPPAEQAGIVRFLGAVDRKVGRFIRAKRRLIEVLTEQKQAIITHAVTKGLNPHAPLKPSGIDWLGDVPEHWEVLRLRNLVSQVTSGSRGWSRYMADTGPLFIRIGNLTRGSLELDMSDAARLQLPKDASEVHRTRAQANDILVSITAYIGSFAVVPEGIEEAYVSQHVALCRPRPTVHNARWIGYVLLSPVGQAHGKFSLNGGTKDGLSLDDVKNHPVLMPPPAEQDRIVAWIESESAQLNASITAIKREIDLIREYRTRLVADVVTGKVDVRGVNIPHALSPDAADALDDAEDIDTEEEAASLHPEAEEAEA